MPSGAEASAAGGQELEGDRRGGERRRGPTRPWDFLLGRARRHRGRRTGDHLRTYVDRYRRRDLLLLVAVFALNILDALFTLIWVGEGGGEKNPLMDRLLQSGDQVFINVKFFISGLAFVVLVASGSGRSSPSTWACSSTTSCFRRAASRRSRRAPR
jgi:hypothetical protein